MMASILVYTGLMLLLFGTIAAIRPLRRLGICSRARASILLVAGLLAVGAGWALPSPDVRIVQPRTQLDQVVPVYQFSEFHSITVRASRQQTYKAIKAVTAGEIPLFQTLTWIRRLGRPGPESILNAPNRAPLLEVATRTSFVLVADTPADEIVIAGGVVAPRGFQVRRRATVEDFRRLTQPGLVLVAMNFRLEDDVSGSCVVTTETRVYATDAWARRSFARYWSVIYPGSALIRRMWLRAIRQRAERSGP